MPEKLLPIINKDLCIGCNLCVAACPYEVLTMVDRIAVVVKPEACEDLESCVEACPTAAINMGMVTY